MVRNKTRALNRQLNSRTVGLYIGQRNFRGPVSYRHEIAEDIPAEVAGLRASADRRGDGGRDKLPARSLGPGLIRKEAFYKKKIV